MFFNASNVRWMSWFTEDDIFDTISVCPNQIKLLSPTIKENKYLIYFFFNDEIPFGFFPEKIDLNHFVHLNTRAITIFDNKLIENL